MGMETGSGPDRSETERLFRVVYDELRAIAERYMRRERCDHTLQPTALVHEAYLKLQPGTVGWQDRNHFLGFAARAMRQVLVDCARRHDAEKRQGLRTDWTLSAVPATGTIPLADYLAVHEALEALAALQPNGQRHARLIELVWLAGLSFTEAAAALGISRRQAHRDWAWARTWLEMKLSTDRSP